jgi:ribosome-associated heat shock protein Hsp15
MKPLRVDKWLWAVRVYKSRSLSTHACRAGRVRIAGRTLKPSYCVRVNDVIEARLKRRIRTLKVLALLNQRVSAKQVPEYCEEALDPVVTKPQDEFFAPPEAQRAPGEGRPTKRDRREIDELFNL